MASIHYPMNLIFTSFGVAILSTREYCKFLMLVKFPSPMVHVHNITTIIYLQLY